MPRHKRVEKHGDIARTALKKARFDSYLMFKDCLKRITKM
jgi:hypothetical protein